jgi:hypothetical protein
MSNTVRLWRPLCLAVLMALTACSEGPDDPIVPAPDAGTTLVALDPCGGTCSNVQLCVKGEDGAPICANICANQFHCWTGCCRPLDDSGYNVCRPSNVCFPGN